MDVIEAKVILKVFLKRMEVLQDGTFRLAGVITDDEVEAIKLALGMLDVNQSAAGNRSESTLKRQKTKSNKVAADSYDLDLSVFTEPSPQKNVRICIDFGTAMSKATLVADDEDGIEDITVLALGVPGDNEEISQNMLVSSIFIDAQGMLWFGQSAVRRSLVDGADGTRQRLDNIKRRLSEDGLNAVVGSRFNPTSISITYGDMILAYLTYLTWVINQCLNDIGLSRNVIRRYAMPCLPRDKNFEVENMLSKMLGQAQILADTFSETLTIGILLSEFMAALNSVQGQKFDYGFVDRGITEPLGVAGAFVSWQERMNVLAMVVDIGAGTSDMSLYRINIDPDTGINTAVEVKDSARGLPEAGNHLDKLLVNLILKKAGITSEDSMFKNIIGALELDIRNLKETLFNDGSVFVPLMNDSDVNIELSEFLNLDQVQKFGQSLKDTMKEIMECVDSSWAKWACGTNRYLGVILTGGGALLPMAKELASGTIRVRNLDVEVRQSKGFPRWLRDIDENLEEEYPRIAVSLGGARKRLIERGGEASITADVEEPAILGGYYQKGT